MPVPKRKTSKSRKNKRSSCKGINPKPVNACQTCGVAILPHQACKECGYYKGVKVLRTKADRMHKRGETRKLQQEKETLRSRSKQTPVEQ